MKKNALNALFVCFYFLIASMNGAVAQQERYISGCITDAESNKPISEVSVFFDNTTAGTITDINGNYRLTIPGEGSYRLTVSHVGYQTFFKDIEPGRTTMKYDITLNTIELEELTVTAKVRFRQTDINLFWMTILGKTPSRRTIQATTPEKVYYYYNTDTRILTVTCREPLQIVNYETGYQIQYVLNHFTHDYNTGFTDWRYQSVFTELEPQNLRQKDTWGKNRKEVYDISITKFFKSLYHNTLLADGFVLADFDLSLISEDEMVSTISLDNSKTIDFNHLVLLICYGSSVTDRDLARLQTSQQATQQTVPSIALNERSLSQQLQYERYSTESQQRSDREQLMKNRTEALQQLQQQIQNIGTRLDSHGKIMNTLQGYPIRIFPDGSFSSTVSMGRVNNSASLMGIGMRLPTDYVPEASTLPAKELAINDKYLFNDITLHFNDQLNIFPQEKIHLHTDRDFYVPGEKIWFKAYVVDAHTHTPLDSSRYVYAELISPDETLITRVMIRPENDLYYGHLFLSEMIPEGNYTLRAYTKYMENLGDDYFFKKNIRIGNLERGNRGNGENPGNRGSIKDDFDVSFYPEGGSLVEGVWNKVAFKALNRNGYAEMITGKIVDETGAEITSAQTLHAGMGVFAFMPEQGKRCFLKCQNGKGLEKQFELPQSDPRACALTVSQHNNRVSVSIRKSTNSPNSSFYLLAQCRGLMLYFAEWDKENEYISFAEDGFPAGVIQFLLFDEQMNPLSERLVFCKNPDEMKVEFQTDKASYEKREKVTVTLTSSFSGIYNAALNTSEFQIQQSQRAEMQLLLNCSVAITDDADIAVDSTTTIHSSLLLSSELKGYIENPAWYLQDNIQSSTALDYLMMTHGWRKYNIPEVAKGNPEYPRIPYQTSQKITGHVKRTGRSGSVANSDVLIYLIDGDFNISSTDEKGRFLFQDFEYPDSTTFFIRALGKQGNERLETILDEELFPKLIYAQQSPATKSHITEEETKSEPDSDIFIMKAEQRSLFDENMRLIHLGEVVISAPRIERKEEPRFQYWANKNSDVTIQREEIERISHLHVADYLTTVSGVEVFRDNVNPWRRAISIRGYSTINASAPLIVIDGVPMDSDALDNLSVAEVESIDVFKYASTTAFGVRGANGVISVTTRLGGGNNNTEKETLNYISYTPLGYQTPVEFYAPEYEIPEAKHSVIPDYRTTIYWKPDLVISEDKNEVSFDFFTSDFKTTYSVVIEGLTTDGRIIRQVGKIQVQ
ncbi:MAG: carboxypeptidase-like regulatory domain-containing protein [Tannerella sp.]|nr:carboxypeptidase-like regulatory domain-containing protein [Tannerella sp.]